MSADFELAIVVPVFNEEDQIESLIRDWEKVFSSCDIRHCFYIVDDGSTDRSREIIESLAKQKIPIDLETQENRGHGPAILNGYRKAMLCDWVFQIDGDHQFETNAFVTMWNTRHAYDFLIATRKQKNETKARQVVSSLSRRLVRVLFGKRVRDVNSPYRLMRSSVLVEILPFISKKSFAPNTLLSAYFVRKHKAIFITEVNTRKGAATRKSMMTPYMFGGVLKSFVQTIRFRFKQ